MSEISSDSVEIQNVDLKIYNYSPNSPNTTYLAITLHLQWALYTCGEHLAPTGGCQKGSNEFGIFSNLFNILSSDILDLDIKS
jgi:hypothetical protein